MQQRYIILIFTILFLTLAPYKVIAGQNELRATGIFTNTITKGQVSIFKKKDKWYVRLEKNFIHDGSPDPWVALGKDGFQRHGIIGELKNFSGPQEFLIGEKLNPTAFNEIYIWCVEHNTSLGRAKLEWN